MKTAVFSTKSYGRRAACASVNFVPLLAILLLPDARGVMRLQ